MIDELNEAFGDLVRQVRECTAGLDAESARQLLQSMLRLQEEWNQCVDAVVGNARRHLTWSEIGSVAGVTKQAAHHRWSGVEPVGGLGADASIRRRRAG
jgi:hypothetical protein